MSSSTAQRIIVVDDAIPYAEAAFGSLGQVRLVRAAAIDASAVRDALALVVRSVTRVDAALVEGSRLTVVGTATSGLDHVDQAALRARGIRFGDAGGCNAEAVADHAITALCVGLAALGRAWLDEVVIGVVGCGRIGGRVVGRLRRLGARVLVCDPPRAAAGDTAETFVELDALIAQCDALTLHVPFTTHGPHPTAYLLDATRVGALGARALLVNTSRGGVVQDAALGARAPKTAALDVWDHEPALDWSLVRDGGPVALATPHIAGYTLEAKVAATRAMHALLAGAFGVEATWTGASVLPPPAVVEAAEDGSRLTRLGRCLLELTALGATDRRLRAEAAGERRFEALRRAYPLRRELAGRAVSAVAADLVEPLATLGVTAVAAAGDRR